MEHRITDPVKARAAMAEMFNRGIRVEGFPKEPKDADWLELSNAFVKVFEATAKLLDVMEHDRLAIPAMKLALQIAENEGWDKTTEDGKAARKGLPA